MLKKILTPSIYHEFYLSFSFYLAQEPMVTMIQIIFNVLFLSFPLFLDEFQGLHFYRTTKENKNENSLKNAS